MSAARSGAVGRLRGGLGRYPRQFWLVFASWFFFLASSAIVLPYFGIYMTERLGLSTGVAGAVLGAASLAGLPLQVVGGSWADRRGRRSVMLFSMAASALVFLALALAHSAWLAVLLVVLNGALGWPLFLVASNAMVADLVEQERTAEAYSVVRIALNAGVVAGPAAAGFALAAGLSFSWLFAAAAGGCAILFVVLFVGLAETRPNVEPVPPTEAGPLDAAEAMAAAAHRSAPEPVAAGVQAAEAAQPAAARQPGPEEGAPGSLASASSHRASRPLPQAGYARVLADRRFLLFCLVSLLPLFCYGQIVTTYPVFLTQTLHVPLSRWGLLLSLNGIIIVAVQYPLVRRLQGGDLVRLLSIGTACLAVGVGAAAFVFNGWPLVMLILVFSVGEMLFVPLSTSMVSGMASVTERGRYMGLWSLFWIGGQALSPLLTGFAMDALGGRVAFFVVLMVGLAGAVLFLGLGRLLRG